MMKDLKIEREKSSWSRSDSIAVRAIVLSVVFGLCNAAYTLYRDFDSASVDAKQDAQISKAIEIGENLLSEQRKNSADGVIFTSRNEYFNWDSESKTFRLSSQKGALELLNAGNETVQAVNTLWKFNHELIEPLNKKPRSFLDASIDVNPSSISPHEKAYITALPPQFAELFELNNLFRVAGMVEIRGEDIHREVFSFEYDFEFEAFEQDGKRVACLRLTLPIRINWTIQKVL